VVANDHEDDYNQINADLDRINADLDKLSSEIPAGKKEKIEKIAVKINEKINSIIGVDEKIYGPFAPEDVVILPKLNADILIDKNKAKLVDI
jgi:DNA replication factor GINS